MAPPCSAMETERCGRGRSHRPLPRQRCRVRGALFSAQNDVAPWRSRSRLDASRGKAIRRRCPPARRRGARCRGSGPSPPFPTTPTTGRAPTVSSPSSSPPPGPDARSLRESARATATTSARSNGCGSPATRTPPVGESPPRSGSAPTSSALTTSFATDCGSTATPASPPYAPTSTAAPMLISTNSLATSNGCSTWCAKSMARRPDPE